MQALKQNLMSETFWLRLLFMALFLVLVEIATSVMVLLIVIQFIHQLFTGRCQANLMDFSHGLGSFVLQSYQFLTHQTETKPYPFTDWPKPQQPTNEHS